MADEYYTGRTDWYSSDAEASDRGFCLCVACAVSDQMAEEGLTGAESIPELSRRYRAVMRGDISCPAMPDCPTYQRALSSGKTLLCDQPRQLSFESLLLR